MLNIRLKYWLTFVVKPCVWGVWVDRPGLTGHLTASLCSDGPVPRSDGALGPVKVVRAPVTHTLEKRVKCVQIRGSDFICFTWKKGINPMGDPANIYMSSSFPSP